MPATSRNYKLFAGLILFFFAWWGYFAISEWPASLHQDMTEAYVWGQEFQLGYHQHPPFWAWLSGLWFLVWPRTATAFFALSALNATIGLWGACAAIRRYGASEERQGAAALLVLTPLYTFFAFKFNANSIFLSLWPWTLVAFDLAVAHRRARDAFWLGALIAAGILSKYFALIFDATLLIALAVRPDRSAYLRSRSPWISAATAFVLVSPHLVWLILNDAPPLQYMRSVSGLGPLAGLYNAQATFFGALAALAVPIIAAVAAARRPIPASRRIAFANLELSLLTISPLALSLAAAIVLQVKLATVMLMGAFPLAPLWLVRMAPPRDPRKLGRIALNLAFAFCAGALVFSPGVARLGVRSGNARFTQPRQELAAAATQFWRDAVGQKLSYVAGTPYYDDALAFYSQERPHAFSDFDFGRAGWVTPELIKARGLLSVCVQGDAHCRNETERYATPASQRKTFTLAHDALGFPSLAQVFEVTAIPPS